MRNVGNIRSALDRALELLHVDASAAQELAEQARAALDVLLDETLESVARKSLLSEQLRAETVLAICMSLSGQLHRSIQRGLFLLDQTSTVADLSTRARLLNMLGVNHDILEQHDEALAFYRQCLTIQRQLGDNDAIARVLGNIGVVYSRLGDDLLALEHLEEAIQLGGERPGRQARHTLNASISHRRLGALETAERLLDYAEEHARQANHQHTLTYILVNRADLLESCGKTDAALETLRSALISAQELPRLRLNALLKMALLLKDIDINAAAELAHQGLAVAADQDAVEAHAQLHELLSNLASSAGDYRSAFEHHRQMHTIRSVLFQNAQDVRIANLRAVHELERMKRERDWLAREREVLSESTARLVELDHERKELLSITAHEIRSPLTLVSLIADELCTEDLSSSDLQYAGKRLTGASTRILSIIDKLLSARALEVGGRDLTLQVLNPADVLSQVLALLRPLAARKSIRINTESDPNLQILADPISLEQVLDNLISNAIKFSPPGSLIEIVCEELVESVSVSVLDSGPGLQPQDQERLFQKYARLSARPTGDEPSTGLGLYISHQLIKQMHGEIFARNCTLGGAQFTFTLPAPKPS